VKPLPIPLIIKHAVPLVPAFKNLQLVSYYNPKLILEIKTILNNIENRMKFNYKSAVKYNRLI